MELKYFPNGNGLFNLNIKRMRKNKNSDTIFLYIIVLQCGILYLYNEF